MNTAVVGAARVVFGADTSQFDSAAKGVEGVLGRLVDRFRAVEDRLKRVGTATTLGLTVPFAAMVRVVDKGAGAFEGQMKRVEAALDNVTGEQLKALSDQARALGPAVGKGATEAATGIEELGLAGLSTADILGGGLKATLDLAAAGMVDVAPAAGLVTDVMAQFKKTAGDLPAVVGGVVGAMDASKFGFEDFAGAVAQGGGVAASAGISFDDFATAVAATSSQFSSGTDNGTSFKTYIQSLVGNSDEAKAAMKKLGIEFFDTNGRMKPLAEQAAILRKALGDLTDESKTDALKTIFGSDAARTAIGLMEQGREGFEALQKTVAGGDVEAKIAKRLEGSAAAGQRIANAWESLKIAIGDTGLLDAITAVKNGFATMLEAIAHAPPAVMKIGGIFAALTATIGPLLVVLGHLAAFLLARVVAGFGFIGRAIALVLSPVSTIIGLLGEYGLGRVLGMIAGRFAAFLGPVGLVIGAFVLLKASILPILQQVYDKVVATLGPPLEAIIAKVSGIFAQIANGPIGAALAAVMTLLGGLADVIGTVVAGVLAIFGELLVRTLSAAVTAFGGFVDAVGGVVIAVNALLSGDFAGAWNALVGVVGSVCDTIVSMVVAMVPDMELPLRTAYEAAKAWLGDGFAAVGGWMGTAVASMVNFVANAFPNVVSAAKGVYDGVKGWLVDKFGWLLDWVSKAAKFISDKYQALKANLGLGGAAGSADPAPPAAPKPVVAPPITGPKRTVGFDDDNAKKKRERKGRDTAYDASNRDELRLQAELEAARARGDRETEQRLQDRLNLEKQVEAYQRTGLSLDQARSAAQRDLAAIQAARATAASREIADEQASVAADVSHLDRNAALEQSLDRQAELKKRIAFYYAQVRDLAEATRLAEADQAKVDEARARARARWFADDAQDRELRLAKLRGATDEEVRQLQRVIDIRERARELEEQGNSAGEAQQQATLEWSEEDRARVQGDFRATFRDGVRAAMEGDLKSFVKNWWKDRVAKGMEEALNSLADLIQSLFAKAGSGATAGSGGGLGATIGNIIGSIFGKSTGGGISERQGIGSYALDNSKVAGFGFDASKLPAFATGGSFRVAGMSGIDRNVVSFRATRGEMVDISRPGNDNGPGGDTFVTHLHVEGGVDLATRSETYRLAGAVQDNVMRKLDERDARRG